MHKNLKNYLKTKIKKKFLQPQKIKLNGRSFFLPRHISGFYPNLTMSELWMIDLIDKIKLKEGAFLDVGANAGQTLLKLRALNEMDYVGFEPNFKCVTYLNDLIKLNNFKNVDIIPVGISSYNGLLPLYSYNGGLDSSATIIKGFKTQEVKEKFLVPVLNIETINKTIKLGKIDFIKIDVEGAELQVLQSFKNLIISNLPVILLEVLPVNHIQSKRMQNRIEIQKLLFELNYDIFMIIKTDKKILELKQIKEFGIINDLNQCDYLLKPIQAIPVK